jgi:thiol:disulfide interchange protein DsbC
MIRPRFEAPARRRPVRGAGLPPLLMLLAGVVLGGAAVALALRPSSSSGSAATTADAARSTPAATAPVPVPGASAPVSTAAAGEAAIRETLKLRIPDFPPIDEITPTPVAGLYELRIGTDVLYADERGRFLVEGQLVDTGSRTNLTQARIEKLTAIDFAALPLADAIVWKQGAGTRKVAVFADPNCGYCRNFERELNGATDVTVYTFLMPILGPDSTAKTRDIWCAKDRTATWRGWMVEGATPPKAGEGCDTAAIERNLALGRKHRINGTPAIVFEDGKRVPGAMPLPQFEQQLAASTRRS